MEVSAPGAWRGRLVLVEDEDAIVRPLLPALRREGFEVRRFATGEEAVAALDRGGADLVVMDLGLPGMSGLEACRAIRRTSAVPVLILTARGSEADRLSGFAAGADDYLPKPFAVQELTARVRAILRRTAARARRPAGVLAAGELSLDAGRREVRLAGRMVPLAAREYDLLEYLMRRSPRVVSRGELIAEVWDPHWAGPTKTLDVHVAQLRRKLERDADQPRYLHTVRGVGYQVRDACDAG